MKTERRERHGLEEVLANHRGQAAVLRHQGHGLQAESIERVCAEVAKVMEPYLDWLTEDQARTRSGRSLDFLRARFPMWEAAELARWSDARPPRRQYRRLIIPLRANLEAARNEADRMAREEVA